MVFCRPGDGPIPICNTKLFMVPRNMITEFHSYISIFTSVIACTDGWTDRESTGLYISQYLSRLVLGDTNNGKGIKVIHSMETCYESMKIINNNLFKCFNT